MALKTQTLYETSELKYYDSMLIIFHVIIDTDEVKWQVTALSFVRTKHLKTADMYP